MEYLLSTVASCSHLKKADPTATSGNYDIDPDGEGDLEPFSVYCDMVNNNGVGVTVISHDSENRTFVHGFEAAGSYSRVIHYTGANVSQLASLTAVSSHGEQFIKYECFNAVMYQSIIVNWWVSRDSTMMTYWGGTNLSYKCACGMTDGCANPGYGCNCDANDGVWCEDSGLLTDKTKLPVIQLRFGDTGEGNEEGYHTLGEFKCYGTA